jgi:hypothetical protein
MSDIDRTRMIPLHIADQAVAACDAEIAKLRDENARLKAFNDEALAHIAKEERKSRERLEMEQAENARLKAEVERLTKQNALATPRHLIASQDIKTLREQVERLTKAVMHSPAAQIKLKELEGKTTYEEINPDNQ